MVGAEVELGERCQLLSHVAMEGPTTIGADNRFYPFCSIGLAPQDISSQKVSRPAWKLAIITRSANM